MLEAERFRVSSSDRVLIVPVAKSAGIVGEQRQGAEVAGACSDDLPPRKAGAQPEAIPECVILRVWPHLPADLLERFAVESDMGPIRESARDAVRRRRKQAVPVLGIERHQRHRHRRGRLGTAALQQRQRNVHVVANPDAPIAGRAEIGRTGSRMETCIRGTTQECRALRSAAAIDCT